MIDSTRLLLVRHGRTDPEWQAEKRLSGSYDPPLGPGGCEDARRAAVKLAAAGACAALYTSPLRRALETAHVIASALGLAVLSLDGAREIRCGVLDGAPLQLIQEKYPDIWARNGAQNDAAFRWPGGESYAEFRRRVHDTFSTIAGSHAGCTVVVVTHTGVITQVLGMLNGISPARWETARPAHGTVTEIHWRSGGPESAVSW